MGCGASSNQETPAKGKNLVVFPAENGSNAQNSPKGVTPGPGTGFKDKLANPESLTGDNETTSPTPPTSSPGSICRLYNTRRLVCNFEEGDDEDKKVLWKLMRGTTVLQNPPPMNEAPRNPIVSVGCDFGRVNIQLSEEEASSIASSNNNTSENDDGQIDLSGLDAARLLAVRSRNAHVRDFRVRTIPGHSRAVRTVGVSLDGRLLVTGDGVDARQALRCANPRTGVQVGSLNAARSINGSGEAPCDLCFSSNGQLLATCDQSDTILLWDMTTFRCKKTVQLEGTEGSELFVVGVRLSPDGQLAAAAAEQSDDDGISRGHVVIWDLVQKRQRLIFSQHETSVLCVGFSPDSQRVISGSRDGGLYLWSAVDGSVIHRLEGHPSGIRTCSFNDTGEYVLSTDAKVICVWNVETGVPAMSQYIDGTTMIGQMVRIQLSPQSNERVHMLRFMVAQFIPGGMLLVASSNKLVRFLDRMTGRELASFTTKAPVTCASPGTNLIAMGDVWGNVYVVDLELKAGEPGESPQMPLEEAEEVDDTPQVELPAKETATSKSGTVTPGGAAQGEVAEKGDSGKAEPEETAEVKDASLAEDREGEEEPAKEDGEGEKRE
eukprot:Sspe_Gene.36275::Locus_17552_Transcript_1_1_Confidence_1.000_Length_1920::g.36275::m.36275